MNYMSNLTVNPQICPVTYECVSLIAAGSNIPCAQSDLFTLDSNTGQLKMRTDDMEKFRPGLYEIVIKGSAGS